MTALLDGKVFDKPSPIRGMNQNQARAAQDPLTAEWILNFDCENDFLKQRPGIVTHNQFLETGGGTGSVVMALGTLGAGANEKLFAYVSNTAGSVNQQVFDVSVSGVKTQVMVASNAASNAEWIRYKSLGTFAVDQTVTSIFPTYDGSSWSNGWVQYSTGNKIPVSPSAYYKSRLYTVYNNKIYVGAVYQQSGVIDPAVTPQSQIFDIDQIYELDKGTSWIATFSQTDGQTNAELIAFGNKVGEVLIYSGEYPNSSTWQRVGKMQIDSPVSIRQNGVIQFQSDALIVTQKGLVSLKDLYNKGNTEALEQAISEPINKYWTQLTALIPDPFAGSAKTISGIWAKRQRKIYVVFQGHISASGTYDPNVATMLVCNTVTKAWSIYRIPQPGTGDNDRPGNLIYFKNNIYFTMANGIYRFDPTAVVDTIRDGAIISSIPLEIDGPYEAYGTGLTSNKSIVPSIYQSLPLGGLEFYIWSDFGVSINGPAQPLLPFGYSSSLIPIGVTGRYSQWRLRAQTRVSGINALYPTELYAMGVLLIKGGV